MVKKLRKLYPAFTDLKKIRSSLIAEWLKKHNFREIQYMAGHRYISLTERYLQRNIESLKEELGKFHPLG